MMEMVMKKKSKPKLALVVMNGRTIYMPGDTVPYAPKLQVPPLFSHS